MLTSYVFSYLFVCVQVFHTLFWPLEYTVANRDNNKCYGKVICNKLDSVRQLLLPYFFVPAAPGIERFVTVNRCLLCRTESSASTISVQTPAR